MLIRRKYYPYPVVATGSDAYVNTKFATDVTTKYEGYNVKFNLSANINNDAINELIKTKKAAFVFHFECAQTCFRTAVTTDDEEKEFLIHQKDLSGIVQVCAVIVALEDIKGYRNDDFSSDYKGIPFNIQKGCVLAIGSQFSFDIKKEKDELESADSIFTIVPIKDESVTTLEIDTSNSKKLTIRIPQLTYNKYKRMSNNLILQPLMHSVIIIPALIATFEELKRAGDDLYLYEDYRWYKSLNKTCKKFNIVLDKEGLSNIDAFKTAQLIMDSPIVRALDNLVTEDD